MNSILSVRKGATMGRLEESDQETSDRFFRYVRQETHGNMTCLVWTGRNYRMSTKLRWDAYGAVKRLPHHVHYWICNGALPPGRMQKQCETPLCCNSAHWKVEGDRI